MSKERIYKMDDGSWLTSDKKEGVGRDKMNFDAPSWKGREDRITIRIVKKSDTESMKAITFRQKALRSQKSRLAGWSSLYLVEISRFLLLPTPLLSMPLLREIVV